MNVVWKLEESDGPSLTVVGPVVLVQKWMSSRSSTVNVAGWPEPSVEAERCGLGEDVGQELVLVAFARCFCRYKQVISC
jgi:hypothetical protein